MIIKVVKQENYLVIDKDFINDEKMTIEMIGLMTYLLSKPNDWQVRITELETRFKGQSIKRIMKELRLIGYVKLIKINDKETGKISGSRYDIFEKAQTPQIIKNTKKPRVPKTDTRLKPTLVKSGDILSNEINQESKIKNFVTEIENHIKYKSKEDEPKTENEILFESSKYFDIITLTEALTNSSYPPCQIADPFWYKDKVLEWAKNNNAKQTENGWLTTIKKFISNDKSSNKVVTKENKVDTSSKYKNKFNNNNNSNFDQKKWSV